MGYTSRAQHYILAALTLALASCSGSSTPSIPPPGEVTLDPSTAPAASMVKVDGLELDACPLRTSEIRVAGQTAPTVLNARHEALMRLPLFYDEDTKWAAPPNGPQDVEVFCNGNLWLTLPAAITITELPPAPGATEAIVADYQQIVADYRVLADALAPEETMLQHLFTATFDALEELVVGDPDSLAAQLETLKQTEPDTLALMDAVYAVDDIDEAVAAFRDHIANMSAEVAAASQASPAAQPPSTASKAVGVFEFPVPIYMFDDELAALMRAQHGIEAFSEDFIAPTAESFGTFEGLLSLVVKSKLASTINTVLSMLDFILNKVVTSAIPSQIDKIELELVKTDLESSEVTQSMFVVHASNVPERLGITDLTSAILMTMGLDSAPGGQAAEGLIDWTKLLKERLKEAFKLFLEKLSKVLEKLFGKPGGFEFDLETFAIVPQFRFEATGTTRELYDLYPQRSSVVDPLPDQLEWQASETYWGSANVYVTPAAGAFGPQNTWSNQVPVQVGELALVLEQPRVTVPEGETATVGVKLSHAPPPEEGTLEVFAIRVDGDADITIATQLPLLFDDTNWDRFQDITLAAAQDDDPDSDESTVIVSTVVDVVVPEPQRIETDLTAVEGDDDRKWFVLEPSSVRVPEGETAELGVKLSSKPSSKVTAIVTHEHGDTDVAVQSPTVMRFDEDNWDDFQTVTLYAHPDEDLVEGMAHFLVSANPPAEIDEAYITATEDEPGDMLHYRWSIDNGITAIVDGKTVYVEGRVKYVAAGVIPVMLDMDADPETILGTVTGTATRTEIFEGKPKVRTGTSTLTVRNHWTNTVCYCGSPVTEYCFRNDDLDNIHNLAVDTKLNVSTAPEQKQEGRRDIVVFVGKDDPYSVSYDCGGAVEAAISAELR